MRTPWKTSCVGVLSCLLSMTFACDSGDPAQSEGSQSEAGRSARDAGTEDAAPRADTADKADNTQSDEAKPADSEAKPADSEAKPADSEAKPADSESEQQSDDKQTEDKQAEDKKSETSTPDETKPPTAAEPLYATATVVFNAEGQDSYVALLKNLDAQEVDLKNAREFSGWSGINTNGKQLFVTDGESPTMTRFDVSSEGEWTEMGKINFSAQGAEWADSLFISEEKAYVFPPTDAIVWSPKEMAITSEIKLELAADRPNGMEYGRLGTGRSAVVRGNRLFVATSWANWDDYAVSEDSLIVVIDTDQDRIIDMLPADCPYLDVATLADDGSVYFSNWVYSVGQTLTQDKAKACAVRIKKDEDKLDADWKVTFADVTGGHEGAALGYLGGTKALLSVFHEERVDFDAPDADLNSIANSENWELWILDLETLDAKPVDGISFNTGGITLSRVDGRGFVMVPTDDYASTSVYEVSPNGSAKEAWTINGWSMQLIKIR